MYKYDDLKQKFMRLWNLIDFDIDHKNNGDWEFDNVFVTKEEAGELFWESFSKNIKFKK